MDQEAIRMKERIRQSRIDQRRPFQCELLDQIIFALTRLGCAGEVHTTLESDVVGELRIYRLKVKRREVKLVLEILRDVGELTLYPNRSWKLRGLETTVFKDQLGGVGRKMEKNSFQVLDESLMFLRRTAMEFDRRREQALLRYTDANDRARAILPDTTAECIRLVSNLHIATHHIEMVMQGLAEAVTQSK